MKNLQLLPARIAFVQTPFDESFRQSELSEKELILPPTTQPNNLEYGVEYST